MLRRMGTVTDRMTCRARLLDLTEWLLVLLLYVGLMVRSVVAYRAGGRMVNLVLLPSEGLVVLFVLMRRGTTEISRSPRDWGTSLGATCLPLLVGPASWVSPIPQALGVYLFSVGTLIQVSAKLSLGRSFGCVPAHRGLRLNGPYRLVRHPMYAGYLITHVAYLALNPTLTNALLYLASNGLQLQRLLAEERYLERDPRYQEYLARVHYRIIPGLY
jgi:protein-S-isoprenylcysteine O-methyltransferase Ste14